MFVPATSFAADDIKVTIDGNSISFDTVPERSGNTIMVPMKEFFEALGARVLWVESERMVVAYKDNMHMKLQLGNNIAYRNGKKFALESNPYISDGHTLVPIQIIAETFNMRPEWNDETNTLALSGSDSDAGLKLFSDGIYKTKPIDELGITISIPYHWVNLDGPYKYGYQDDFESYSVTLMSQPINKDMSLTELVDANKALLLDTYDENITFTGEEILKIDNLLDVHKLYITTLVDQNKQKQVLYILKQDDKAYFMTCHYGEEVPEEDIIEVFDNVISTFKIRNLSIDSEEEHYMEFEDFYRAGVQLNQEYYSNMVVEKSEIPFSGTLKEGHGLKAFSVRVSSDQDSLEFNIPIIGNAFDGTLYTPFGLGKHNIFISGIVDENATVEVTEEDVVTLVEENEETTSATETTETTNIEVDTEVDTEVNTDNNTDSITESINTSEDTTLNDSGVNDTTNNTNSPDDSSTVTDTQTTTDTTSGSNDSDVANDNNEVSSSEESSNEEVNTPENGESDTGQVINDVDDGTTLDDSNILNGASENDTTTPAQDNKSEDLVDPVDEVIEASSETQTVVLEETELHPPLMQFSIINIDSRTMRYRIPTNIIRSNDVQINSTSMLITYQVSNEYMKARALYNWMLTNVAIDPDKMERSNMEVFDDAKGSVEEINQLYVAYLRAIDIPSRVMKGTSSDEAYYWTELYLNGSWVASDVIEALRLKDDAVGHAQGSLFNTNMELFRAKYDLLQIMPY